MQILLVNRSLFARSGTELYTRDLALALRKRGHEVFAFTPSPGGVSEELEEEGIPVFSDPGDLPEATPDVIHAHHTWETLAVAARYPGTPMVFVGHDLTAWHDTPPRLRQIRRYVGVDSCLEKRFVKRHGIDQELVSVVPNPIDFSRFPLRPPLPEKPRKALLLSNYAGPAERDEVGAACEEHGIELDAVGWNFGNQSKDPGSLFPHYEIVIAKGRSGLEAAQAGCSVVFGDTWGCGPLLYSDLFRENHGMFPGRVLLSDPFTRETISERIASYDPDDAERVASIVRETYDSDRVAGVLEGLYQEALQESSEVDVKHSGVDLARELSWWSIRWEEELKRSLEASERLRASQASEKQTSVREGVLFGDPIRGDGWDEVERDAHGPFRWMSPAPQAWIELAVPEELESLEFTIAHSVVPSMPDDLRVTIKEHPIPLQLSPGADGIRALGRVPGGLRLDPGEVVQITFAIPLTHAPAELYPGHPETRPLGIALREARFRRRQEVSESR